ncbi:MAG: hypothetical protein NZL83_01345 [Candidatus Absconditabacterales bacterium]|nr:hypothetical protein [Candidatus Absconditabacterales bacterium]
MNTCRGANPQFSLANRFFFLGWGGGMLQHQMMLFPDRKWYRPMIFFLSWSSKEKNWLLTLFGSGCGF